MIGANAHGRSILFANFYQRSKAVADAFDFFCIFRIGIFNLFKLFLINIIAGVHSHFFHNAGGNFRSIWCKMNIGNQVV